MPKLFFQVFNLADFLFYFCASYAVYAHTGQEYHLSWVWSKGDKFMSLEQSLIKSQRWLILNQTCENLQPNLWKPSTKLVKTILKHFGEQNKSFEFVLIFFNLDEWHFCIVFDILPQACWRMCQTWTWFNPRVVNTCSWGKI